MSKPNSDNNVTDGRSETVVTNDSGTVDSGFLSWGNIPTDLLHPNSDNIIIADGTETNTRTTQRTTQNEEDRTDFDNCKLSSEYMRLDSGVDLTLSENLSNLNICSQDVINDLGRSNCQELTNSNRRIIGKNIPFDCRWSGFYDQDEDGDTPLHAAIVEGYSNIVLALIRAAPCPFLLDIVNDHGQAPIHLAASTGKWQFLRWLVAAGAKLSTRDGRGDSALHLAVANGDLMGCKAILEPIRPEERNALGLKLPNSGPAPKCQVNYEQWNYVGQTCVHVAALSGNVEILQYLVQQGADINAREGLSGHTALHYAVLRTDEQMVHFLLNDCPPLRADTLNYRGLSALQLDCQIPTIIAHELRSQGLSSPPYYSSEDEDSEMTESDDEQMAYDGGKVFVPCLVNASA